MKHLSRVSSSRVANKILLIRTLMIMSHNTGRGRKSATILFMVAQTGSVPSGSFQSSFQNLFQIPKPILVCKLSP